MKSTIGVLMAALTMIIAPAVVWAGGSPPVALAVYVGPDVDGDGNSDLVVEDSTTGFTIASLLEGVGPRSGVGAIPATNVASGFTTAGFPDLNGDGISDKVVESASGYSVGFLLNGLGAATSAAAIPGTNVAAGFRTVGFPDLNGDGKADKVVENTTTGYTVAFLMDGLTNTSAAAIPGTNIAAGYTTAGFPDINGDGNADKVVQAANGFTVAFLMDGTTVLGSGAIAGTNVAAGYATAGFADINGDGRVDKVVEGANGYTIAFLLDGVNAATGIPFAGTNTAAGFVTVGFPDLNGDGFDDKVVENSTTGLSVAFLSDGTSTPSGAAGIAGTPILSGWALAGFPDLDGDGSADKVISRAADGRTFGYILSGVGLTGSGELPVVTSGFDRVPWGERWNP